MSEHLGMGVMIGMLGGNSETVETIKKAIGQQIAALSLGNDDALHFTMVDGFKFKLYDDGQSCCESRYMRTDDDTSRFVGATLLGAEIRQGPPAPEDDYGVHEVQFLDIKTSAGLLQMVTHNEHNGYYGGFYVVARPE